MKIPKSHVTEATAITHERKRDGTISVEKTKHIPTAPEMRQKLDTEKKS